MDGVWGYGSTSLVSSLLPTAKMNRLLVKKAPKKSFRLSQQPIPFGIPANIVVGPAGFQAELDVGPKGERHRFHRDLEKDRPDSVVMLGGDDTKAIRIVRSDTGSKGEGHPEPGASTAGTIGGDDNHGDRPIGERSQSLPL